MTCTICLEPLLTTVASARGSPTTIAPAAKVAVLRCGHVFHRDCMGPWLAHTRARPHCPRCCGPSDAQSIATYMDNLQIGALDTAHDGLPPASPAGPEPAATSNIHSPRPIRPLIVSASRQPPARPPTPRPRSARTIRAVTAACRAVMAAAAATARRSAFSTVNDVTPTRQPTVPPGPRPGGLQPAPVTAEELEQWVTVDALQRATGFYPQECKYGGSQLEYSPNPQWERLRVEHQYRAGTPEQMRHGSSTEHAHAYAMGTRSATRNSHVVGSPTMLFHVPPGRPDYGQSSAPAHRVSFPVSRNSSIEEWYIGKFHDR